MVHSVFGKMMESMRKQQNVKLCNKKKQIKYARNQQFKQIMIFDDNSVAMQNEKGKIKLEKPIYCL